MFKKVMAGILCFSLLLAGCTANNEDMATGKEEITGDKETESQALKLIWQDKEIYENTEVSDENSQYTLNVPDYGVAPDLSNIENINRVHGFTENQKALLSQNGFVVLPPNPENKYLYMKMYDIYENNTYQQIPNFITVDIALHFYHKLYNEVLKSTEKEFLYSALCNLTESMLQKTIQLYNDDTYSEMRPDLKDILIYYSVANKILNETYGDVPDDMIDIVQKEIDLIQKAEGYTKSPLMGFDVNYEQFIVRGHYAEDALLKKYFKTMMWYGLVGFPLLDGKKLDEDHVVEALLMTYIAFLEYKGKNDIETWDKIYAPTDFFVGQSDDITIFDLKDVILNVYGEQCSIKDFRDKKYEKALLEEINKLPEPQIQNKLVLGAVDTPTKKQFRFMGQRYTLDANILQELMFPILRPVPSGLDVAAALGNKQAEDIAYQYYVPEGALEKYKKNISLMKLKVEEVTREEWKSNLYNGWLWSIKSVLDDNTKMTGLPYFMKSEAWQNKEINTALGSYAELKHDTVLYAKQPAAEMGGYEPEYIPQYVEPAVEVYDRLIWLIKYSKTNLEARNLLSEQKKEAIDRLMNLYILLRDCSIKELKNEPLTEEENNRLMYVGGAMNYIDNCLSTDFNIPPASALVSDIAGIADAGSFLEIGTEFPNEIYAAIYDQGKIYLARGSVYGYHEFLSSTPLTDEKWHRMLGIKKVQEEDWSFQELDEETFLKEAPEQPEWVYTFKSREDNKVQIDLVEYTPAE